MEKKKNSLGKYNSLQDCEPARIDGGYVKRGSFIGFWKQKSHSSLGHFLYAVQAPLKMPQ